MSTSPGIRIPFTIIDGERRGPRTIPQDRPLPYQTDLPAVHLGLPRTLNVSQMGIFDNRIAAGPHTIADDEKGNAFSQYYSINTHHIPGHNPDSPANNYQDLLAINNFIRNKVEAAFFGRRTLIHQEVNPRTVGIWELRVDVGKEIAQATNAIDRLHLQNAFIEDSMNDLSELVDRNNPESNVENEPIILVQEQSFKAMLEVFQDIATKIRG